MYSDILARISMVSQVNLNLDSVRLKAVYLAAFHQSDRYNLLMRLLMTIQYTV